MGWTFGRDLSSWWGVGLPCVGPLMSLWITATTKGNWSGGCLMCWLRFDFFSLLIEEIHKHTRTHRFDGSYMNANISHPNINPSGLNHDRFSSSTYNVVRVTTTFWTEGSYIYYSNFPSSNTISSSHRVPQHSTPIPLKPPETKTNASRRHREHVIPGWVVTGDFTCTYHAHGGLRQVVRAALGSPLLVALAIHQHFDTRQEQVHR